LITLDTSVVIAGYNTADPDYARITEALSRETTLLLPVGILSEVTFMIDQRFGRSRVNAFLRSLLDNEIVLDWEPSDLPRVLELLERYKDLSLGYADAAVIACAERNGGRVATLDYRHFGVVAREGRLVLVV
jgi:predicted nucleic acid-binding protein